MPLAQYGMLDIPLNDTTPTFHPLCKMSKLSTSKTSWASQGIQALLASFAYGIIDLPLPPGEMTTCPPLLGEWQCHSRMTFRGKSWRATLEPTQQFGLVFPTGSPSPTGLCQSSMTLLTWWPHVQGSLARGHRVHSAAPQHSWGWVSQPGNEFHLFMVGMCPVENHFTGGLAWPCRSKSQE